MIAIPNRSKPVFCGHCRLVELRGGGSWQLICSITRTPIAREEMNDDCPIIDIVTCGECKWWDKDGDRPFGYCHAEKHCYFSTNWEISIYRTYKSDHFCSDGERRSE